MKKMNILLFVFLCSGATALAQVREPVSSKDRMEFQGYSIHLMPALRGTYGYYIVKDKQAVLYQSRNPFTGSPFGLSKKEDAYKVAKWQIQNPLSRPLPPAAPLLQKGLPGFEKRPLARQQPTRQMPANSRPLLPQQVPLKVAGELHINLDNN